MNFSLRRIWALIVKEFLQMRRDRLTLAMIVGIPLAQLFLFGFAINFNPRDLPTAIAINDPGMMARSIVAALANSSYFKIVEQTNDPAHARDRDPLAAERLLFPLGDPADIAVEGFLVGEASHQSPPCSFECGGRASKIGRLRTVGARPLRKPSVGTRARVVTRRSRHAARSRTIAQATPGRPARFAPGHRQLRERRSGGRLVNSRANRSRSERGRH